jgi:hypothetical protein
MAGARASRRGSEEEARVDPVTIAAGTIALLTPFVRRMAEEFAGAGGKAVWDKTQELLTSLRLRLRTDSAAIDALEQFEQRPEHGAVVLQSVLEERLAADPQLLAEINQTLEAIKSAGPNVRVVQRAQEAEDVAGVRARNLRRGQVSVEQEVGRARNVLGVHLEGDIG